MFTMCERWMRKKRSGIQAGFDGVHRLAEQMRVGADVKLDVVAGRLDPVDFVVAHEEDPAAGLDDETIDARLRRLQILDEREEPALEVTTGPLFELLRARARAPGGIDRDRTA